MSAHESARRRANLKESAAKEAGASDAVLATSCHYGWHLALTCHSALKSESTSPTNESWAAALERFYIFSTSLGDGRNLGSAAALLKVRKRRRHECIGER